MNEMPNFTGVMAMPFLSTGLVALNARVAARRAGYSLDATSSSISSWITLSSTVWPYGVTLRSPLP
ncbi:hypothetical protein D3C87_2054320 [compost metagenome]